MLSYTPKIFSKETPIVIGTNILSNTDTILSDHGLVEDISSYMIISDSNVGAIYGNTLIESLKHIGKPISTYIFPAGEISKNLDTVSEIYRFLQENNADRKTLIINLGGGVTSDIGGFVAATYMRGLRCVNISTTIEGMVDASIGGKTGVNFGHTKNIIGAIHHADLVIIDTEVLKTLESRAYVQGFGEILKHGLIADREYFMHCVTKPANTWTIEEQRSIIERSIAIKCHIVENDPNEKGPRKILNFGHTIGHAIESLSLDTDMPLFHGEAVAIGMLIEAKIASMIDMLDTEVVKMIEKSLQRVGLPFQLEEMNVEDILRLCKKDKKNVGNSIRFSLIDKIGSCQYDIPVPEEIVRRALLDGRQTREDEKV